MKNIHRKSSFIAVVIVMVLSSFACLSSTANGNTNANPNNTGSDSAEVDLAATQDSLAATQAALSDAQNSADDSSSDSSDTSSDTTDPVVDDSVLSFDLSNLQSGDVIYSTDFDGPGDWEAGWTHFAIPGESDDYQVYLESGVMYIEVNDTFTTVYVVFDDLYLERDESDVLVEASINNVGTNRNNNISVICRGSDDGWYEFSLTSSGLWFIWEYDAIADSYESLANGGVQNYNKNVTEHVISATCIGDELTFYLDGTQLRNAQITDNTFSEGQTAISLYADNLPGVAVEVEWFEVSVP